MVAPLSTARSNLLALVLLACVSGFAFAALPVFPGDACATYGTGWSTAAGLSATAVSSTTLLASSAAGTYPTCYPSSSANSGTIVSVSGIITAVDVFNNLAWMQPTLASNAAAAAGTALAMVFTSTLTDSVNRGDPVTVVGYYISTYEFNGTALATGAGPIGSDVFEICSFQKTGANIGSLAPPTSYAVSVNTSMFTNTADLAANIPGASISALASNQRIGGACTATTKSYYAQLVTLSSVTVLACYNDMALYGASGATKVSTNPYCNPSLSLSSSPSTYVWDKYGTFWITTDNSYLGFNATGQTTIAVGNTMAELYLLFNLVPGSTFSSLTGVLDWRWSSDWTPSSTFPQGFWTLLPRDKFDAVSGGSNPALAISASSISAPAVSIGTSGSPSLYQWTLPYGNVVPGAYQPANKVGAGITINSSLTGTGLYPLTSNPGYTFSFSGNCPNSSAFTIISLDGKKTQQLCNCYLPNYYDPTVGTNGAGTSYVQASGVVTTIQGVVGAGTGAASFFMQNGCGPGNSAFVYQDSTAGGSAVQVTVGDFVIVTASPYVYYGLVELQNTIKVTVVNSSNPLCGGRQGVALTSLSALDVNSQGHCSATTSQYRNTIVTATNLTVTAVFAYTPWPSLSGGYWYNNTFLGTGPTDSVYGAAFNASQLATLGQTQGNWYNSYQCLTPTGQPRLHPVTGAAFPCGFEVTDSQGYKVVVDECTSSFTAGGLANVVAGTGSYSAGTFVAGDGLAWPVRVGDKFNSITGVVLRLRGSYGSDGGGGYSALCALADPSLIVRAGGTAPSPSTPSTPAASSVPTVSFLLTLYGFSSSQLNATSLSVIVNAVATSVGLSPQYVTINTISTISATRRLLTPSTLLAFTLQPSTLTQAASINTTVNAGLFSTPAAFSSLQQQLSSAGLSLNAVVNGVGPVSLTTTSSSNNKKVLAVGLGVGIGGGCGVIILLGLLYKFVLKKKVRVSALTCISHPRVLTTSRHALFSPCRTSRPARRAPS